MDLGIIGRTGIDRMQSGLAPQRCKHSQQFRRYGRVDPQPAKRDAALRSVVEMRAAAMISHLVPLEFLPRDVPLVVIGEQHLPIALRPAIASDDPLAPFPHGHPAVGSVMIVTVVIFAPSGKASPRSNV